MTLSDIEHSKRISVIDEVTTLPYIFNGSSAITSNSFAASSGTYSMFYTDTQMEQIISTSLNIKITMDEIKLALKEIYPEKFL